MKTERWTVFFAGRVQGVGFRYHCRRIVSALSVTGFVRNLPDGRVELVAEGNADELWQVVEQAESVPHGKVTDRTICREPATGEFERFEIRS